MPCCTYLLDTDHTKSTSDSEINSLLAEIRQKTGDDWRVAEYIYTTKRLFKKPIIKKTYELFNHIGGPEYQVINFYKQDSDSSINLFTDAGYIVSYFYGMLAAIDRNNYDKSRNL